MPRCAGWLWPGHATHLATLRELSKRQRVPVTHEQGTVLAGHAASGHVLGRVLLPAF